MVYIYISLTKVSIVYIDIILGLGHLFFPLATHWEILATPLYKVWLIYNVTFTVRVTLFSLTLGIIIIFAQLEITYTILLSFCKIIAIPSQEVTMITINSSQNISTEDTSLYLFSTNLTTTGRHFVTYLYANCIRFVGRRRNVFFFLQQIILLQELSETN